MKGNLPFDDFIKKQLSNYAPDVPAHIWENIAARRKSKPKGFWINWFTGKNILALVVVAGVLLSGSYILFSPKNDPSKNTISKNKNFASQINNQDNISAGKNNKAIDKSNNDEQETLVDQTISNTQNLAKQKNTFNLPAGNSSVLISKNPYSSRRNNFLFSSSQKNKIKNVVITDERELIKQPSPFENNDEVNNSFVINKHLSSFIFNNARELNGGKKINSLNIKLPDCPTIEKNAAGNKKYWEVYAGPDVASGNYKTFGDTTSNNYLQKRKASTKFASAFSAGIRYTKVFDNGMSVRAGLNYSQINEKFIYFNPNEIKYVTVITTRVIIRQPGDTIYINDTLQYQQSGTRTKTTYNHYRTIDVPLVIGYELGNGKIHANINAGVIINLYSWYKGDVLDTSYQPVSITTGKGASIYQFKNNIGVGFLGSISFYYKLTDKMHLLLEPYFRYNLSPMSKENLNLQQKYNTAGVRAGIRFDLK
jgi:hypothetical protein